MTEPFTVIWPLPDSVQSGGWLEVYQGAQGPYEHAGNDRVKRSGATLGAQVVACQSGIVTINRPGDGWGNGSFGVCARIDHPQGDGSFWSIAAHLADGDANLFVKSGDQVKQGQPVGIVGMTGLTDGPHTHFAIQRGGGGSFDPARYQFEGTWKVGNKQLVDPALYVAGTSGAVTLEDIAASLARTSDVVNLILANGATKADVAAVTAKLEEMRANLRKV